ncbi:MAG: dihydrofolate reductase family protein [Candidatus Micrarchaeota archaeon]|nr:dihydrofolate reductase family protein [Candidatus Micrarchaeota archaeon]
MRGGRNPARIILDSKLQIPLSSKVLENAKKEKVIIATSAQHDRKKRRQLEKMGAQVIVCGKEKADLKKLLLLLPSIGIYSVLIEGGAHVAREAIEKKLADKAAICISQKKIPAKNTILSPFTRKVILKLMRRETRMLGSDKIIEGYFTRA